MSFHRFVVFSILILALPAHAAICDSASAFAKLYSAPREAVRANIAAANKILSDEMDKLTGNGSDRLRRDDASKLKDVLAQHGKMDTEDDLTALGQAFWDMPGRSSLGPTSRPRASSKKSRRPKPSTTRARSTQLTRAAWWLSTLIFFTTSMPAPNAASGPCAPSTTAGPKK